MEGEMSGERDERKRGRGVGGSGGGGGDVGGCVSWKNSAPVTGVQNGSPHL